MCVSVPSVVYWVKHERWDKLQEDGPDEAETLQDCEAVTVNVKEKLTIYNSLLQRILSPSFHLSGPGGRREAGEVAGPAAGWRSGLVGLL